MNKRKPSPEKTEPENPGSVGQEPNEPAPDPGKKKKKHRKKPRLPQVIYLIFLIGATVFVSNRGGAFSYALFYAALIYPVTAFFYLLFVRAELRLHQDLEGRELKKQADLPYRLTVENAGIFPASGITMYYYDDRSVFGDGLFDEGEENKLSLALLPGETREYSATMRCKYAGSYATGVSRITFRDPFLLFTLSMKVPAPLYVQVLPTVDPEISSEMARAVASTSRGLSGSRMTERENILGNDLLPYSPGDPLKRIHWKNYARSGELFVRVPEEKELEMISVVLLARPVADTGEDLERRSRFLDSAVSVAAFFAGQKRPVQFFYFDAGPKRILVEDFVDMYKLCRELSRSLVLRKDLSAVDALLIEEAGRSSCPSLVLREGETILV